MSTLARTCTMILCLAGTCSATQAGVLYGVVGDGGGNGLYTIDTATGTPSAQLLPLGNGNDGEGIAYNPNDGLLYHTSGISSGSEYFETIDPVGLTVGPNLVAGNSYPSPPVDDELTSIVWYDPLGVFIVTDRDNDVYHVTTTGAFTEINTNAAYMRGLAVVGTQVFGVDPFGPLLWELDPATGSILNTLTVSIDGEIAEYGLQGLATDPDTGIVYAIGKDPTGTYGGQNRLLMTLDVTTGLATSIGPTGKAFAGITFIGTSSAVPEPTTFLLLTLGLVGFGVVRRHRCC